MIIDEKLKSKILSHAALATNHEICGLIIETSYGTDYFPCRNASVDPTNSFVIDPDDWIAAEEGDSEVVAVVHSHLNHKPFLSSLDRQSQLQTQLVWVLVCDQELKVYEPRPKLLGREFNYGVRDCCTLVRDALHLCGVDIPDAVRFGLDKDAELQKIPKHLQEFGFYRVSSEDVQVGDYVLFSIGAEANHVGIYIGQDTLLHHLADRLSRREVYGGYLRSKVHSVWRHPCFNPETIEAIWNDMEL